MTLGQRRIGYLTWLVVAAGLAGVVGSGCGGGGGTSATAPTPTPTPAPTPAPTPSSTYFLLGEAGLPASAGVIQHVDGTLPMKRYALVGVDPESPTPVEIEPAGAWGQVTGASWVEGRFDSAGEGVGMRVRYIAYVKGDRYYLLDQVASSGRKPTARPWTTLKPSQVCRTFFYAGGASWVNDFSAPESGYLIVRTPGPDSVCGSADDVARALRLDMSETDDALTIDEPLLAIRDAAQPISFSGHLVRVGNEVVRVDRRFANPAQAFALETAAAPTWTYVIGNTAPGTLLYLDGRKLFAYRLAGGTAPALVLTLASNESITGVAGSTGTHGFIAVTANSASRVLRIATDGSSTRLADTTAPISGLFTTDSSVVALMPNSVATVPKDGGTLLTVLQGDSTWSVFGLYASGETIYARATRSSPSFAVQTRLIESDGSRPATWDDTFNLSVFPDNPHPAVTDPKFWSRIYTNLMFGTAPTGSGNLAGASLWVVNARTRGTIATYGSLPLTPATLGTFNTDNYRQFGYPTLLQTLNSPSGYGISPLDLYLFKSDTAGLTRLTQNVQ